jgi:hypothetical protein
MWLREEITSYDPPRSYSYLIVQSFPAFGHEGGAITCTSVGESTDVDWVTSYSHPFRGGGSLMDACTSRLLPWNFSAILARCASVVEA